MGLTWGGENETARNVFGTYIVLAGVCGLQLAKYNGGKSIKLLCHFSSNSPSFAYVLPQIRKASARLLVLISARRPEVLKCTTFTYTDSLHLTKVKLMKANSLLVYRERKCLACILKARMCQNKSINCRRVHSFEPLLEHETDFR